MKNINGRQYEDFLTPAENPINSVHDLKATRETIRQLLANGTPNWVKWPQDYKAFVKESFAREKEISDTMAKAYQIEDQDILANPEGRKVNATPTRDFIKKLRDNGVKCFTVDNGYPPQTVALWAIRPGSDEAIYVCYLQVPAMYEWSVLKLDRHNVPRGEDFRGWRTVLSQLIIKDILTETRAHEIFGKPALNKISRVYRRTLYFHRNRKRIETPTL
jgi:hypothetical protein